MSDTATLTAAPRLKAKYHDGIRAALKDQLVLGNVMQVPRLEKIVVNMGVGKALQDKNRIEQAQEQLGNTVRLGEHPGDELGRPALDVQSCEGE